MTTVFPKAGDVRVTEKFAFLPTRLDNGSIAWMESYFVKEEYEILPMDLSGWTIRSVTIFHPDRPDTGTVPYRYKKKSQ